MNGVDQIQEASAFAKAAHVIARGVTASAAIVALILSVLMFLTWFQTRSADPLNSTVLTQLRAAYMKSGDQAMASDIRAYDLLARRAFFTSQRQIRLGAYLLLISVLVTVAASQVTAMLGRRLPEPAKTPPAGDFEKQTGPSRAAVAAAGILIAVFAAVLGFASSANLAGTVASPAPPSPHPAPPVPSPGPAPVAAGDDAGYAQNWASFRGPSGNGVAYFTNAPVAWDGATGSGVVWKASVPKPGMGSPVVWSNRVFLSGSDGATNEVYCFDAADGRPVWTQSVTGVPGSPAAPPEVTPDTGFAASTPATDGKAVYAVFANGDLVSLDFSGKTVWSKNLGKIENHYGHSSSLITHAGMLFVQLDQDSGGCLVGLDGATGAEKWRTSRKTISWASPICVNTGRRTELILADCESVRSYDAAGGGELWGVACLNGEVAPSPAYAAGRVFVAMESSKACGIGITNFPPQVAWEYTDILPSVASPLATERYVFLATAGGQVVCLNAATGAVVWQHDFKTGFYASPLLAGDRVYLLDTEGNMQIFKAGQEFQAIGSPSLGEKTVATPAILDGRIYIRSLENLYAVGGRTPGK